MSVGPPSSEAARAVVVEFFAALDDGDVDAAADLVCSDYLDDVGPELERLATYSYDPPQFESEEEHGLGRELVVSLTYSDAEETYSELVRITVSGGLGVQVCGIVPA